MADVLELEVGQAASVLRAATGFKTPEVGAEIGRLAARVLDHELKGVAGEGTTVIVLAP